MIHESDDPGFKSRLESIPILFKACQRAGAHNGRYLKCGRDLTNRDPQLILLFGDEEVSSGIKRNPK
jgi:hypothetical protein